MCPRRCFPERENQGHLSEPYCSRMPGLRERDRVDVGPLGEHTSSSR